MGKERSRDRRESKDSEKRRERDGDRERSRDKNGREEQSKSSRNRERDREREREDHKSRRERDDPPKEAPKDAEKAGEETKQDKEQEMLEAQESTKEIEERISRMREARMKEKASARKKGGDDVRSWVEKSRKMEKDMEKEKKAACKSIAEQDEDVVAEEDEESGYGSKSLAGMKIRHGLDKLMEGGQVILTLKDSNIIAGDNLNEDADELENLILMEQKSREEAYQAAKKKPGIYEDKFQNDINTVKTILPQYDEAIKDEGIELDEAGGINEDSRKKLEQVRLRLQGAALKMESLLGPANKASDFYTEEEMLKFKKPKKVKKIRMKATLDVDALEAEAKAAGSAEQDHGSRAAVSKLKQEGQLDAELRKQTYESVFAKALEESKAREVNKMEVDASEDAVAEEEDEMFARLKKSRELAIKERAKLPKGPQGIAALLKQNSAVETNDAATEASAGRTVVITETEEFCLSLQPDEAISKRVANDAFEDDDEDEKTGMDIQHEDERAEITGPEDMDDDNDDEPPIQEVAVGKGLAGALQLLKERGSLKESVEWGGRNMDKKASKLVGVLDDGKAPQREINLDRRDEYGRTLTPKEAFRILSHKFHGKRPGKTKQEKKMKQHEEELKQKQMAAGDTPLRSMEKMREAQVKSSSPYIVVTGHIKPGQSSDPRSGFATVEKEPIGSLTPMLGDKKGENLMKRRPGDMAPPLPRKKPKA